jgi:hypothetical protein
MSVIAGPNLVTNGLILNLDSSEPTSFSPNVQPSSLDVYAWYAGGGAYQGTLSRDYTTTRSPADGIPMLFATANPGTSAYVGSYGSAVWTMAPAASGQTWTISFWVKGSSAFTGGGYIFGANSSGNYIELGYFSYSVTTGWTRVTGSYTMSNASTAGIQARFDCYNSSVNMWIDGVQIERSSAASDFNSTTNTNGTNWLDTSGYSNHHTLTDYPVVSNSRFTLNGSTQGFTRTSAITGVTSTCSVVIWYSTTDIQELWVEGNQSTSYYLSASNNNNYYNANCGSPTNYVDLNTVVNPYASGYKDGNYHMWEAKSVDFTTWTYFQWFLYPGGWQLAGNVSKIMVYNRIITSAESAQNFAAFRSRFGI